MNAGMVVRVKSTSEKRNNLFFVLSLNTHLFITIESICNDGLTPFRGLCHIQILIDCIHGPFINCIDASTSTA